MLKHINKTLKAVKDYQRKYGLKEDGAGVVGKQTWASLIAGYNRKHTSYVVESYTESIEDKGADYENYPMISKSYSKGTDKDGINSKLSRDYLEEVYIDNYLVFQSKKLKNIDPVSARRLAAFARDHGIKIVLSDGRRTYEDQVTCFKKYGGKYDPEKGWYYPDSIPEKKRLAAKPGGSWHEYGEAVDLDRSMKWMKNLDKDEKTTNQDELKKYGIFKPLTKGNGTQIIEDWHIQPIET